MDGDAFRTISPPLIRRLCGATNFVTGRTYFRAGRVISMRAQGSTAQAVVQGAGFRQYRISISESAGSEPRLSCTCVNHTQWGEPCKHISAALFALFEAVSGRDPSEDLQQIIAERLRADDRKDRDDAALRSLILNYFGSGRLRALVEKHRGGPDLKVSIHQENADALCMTVIVPGRLVPGFLDAVGGLSNVSFKGSATRLEVARERAELSPDAEGTTILRISGSARKLKPDEAARAHVSSEWIFHGDRFYPRAL
jgi:hypothetical protein